MITRTRNIDIEQAISKVTHIRNWYSNKESKKRDKALIKWLSSALSEKGYCDDYKIALVVTYINNYED